MSRFLKASIFLSVLTPTLSWACACGCGIFDVGTNSGFPSDQGGSLSIEYDYVNQNQNRNGAGSASAGDNPDKEIKTHFVTLGGHYMFNRSWGVSAEVPYWHRDFTTTDPDSGSPVAFSHGALGDIRLRAVYTGFSEDMSTGITFGLKLPTGDSNYANFDADTEIGSGSTDILAGVYHLGKITPDNSWAWFGQVNLIQPVLAKATYLPGNEINAAFGAYYNGLALGATASSLRITPLLQAVASVRGSDFGAAADAADSGYQRVLVAPGIEGDLGNVRIYGDVGLPVYQRYNGFQLAAAALYKVIVTYRF